jgi:hypothetical protein
LSFIDDILLRRKEKVCLFQCYLDDEYSVFCTNYRYSTLLLTAQNTIEQMLRHEQPAAQKHPHTKFHSDFLQYIQTNEERRLCYMSFPPPDVALLVLTGKNVTELDGELRNWCSNYYSTFVLLLLASQLHRY